MEVNVKGEIMDVEIKDVHADNYIVPNGEEGEYHCKLEIVRFNQQTGKRESVPRIQKFEQKSYKSLRHSLQGLGYTIEMLHDPTKDLKAEFEKEAEREAKRGRKKSESGDTEK